MIRPISEAQLEQVQAELRHRERERGPQTANAGTVLALAEAGAVFFRGVPWRVPPVSYRDGIRLQQLGDRLAALALAGAPDAEQEAVITEMVIAFRGLVRPVGWRRLLGRLLPNPFRRASEAEVGQLLAFFTLCRTRSSVRLAP